MSELRGRTVLVTGGASGLGYLMGRRFLEEGAAQLIIWDIDEGALQRVTEELSARGHKVRGFRVDIARLPQVREAVKSLTEDGRAVDVLVNNAGVVVGKTFVDHTAEDIERTMTVNAVAPMHVTRELLPGMVARRTGHIVNIASAAGMVSNPRMSVYCASKSAMIGWSDSLRLELDLARTGVKVTTVTPYYVGTGMFAGVRSPVIPILDPDEVARAIVSAVKHDRAILRLPRILYLLPFVLGIMPRPLFDLIVGRWLGVYRSMDAFRGRP
jgi:all-trans-retinol dehydrogenase (NAD+)